MQTFETDIKILKPNRLLPENISMSERKRRRTGEETLIIDDTHHPGKKEPFVSLILCLKLLSF